MKKQFDVQSTRTAVLQLLELRCLLLEPLIAVPFATAEVWNGATSRNSLRAPRGRCGPGDD